MVLSVMTASGGRTRSFRSKCTWSGSLRLGAAGRPVVGAEPDREHRRRRDRAVGERGGDVVVPEQRVAVLDRRAVVPEVAALDGEVGRSSSYWSTSISAATSAGSSSLVDGLGHAITPASRSAAHSSVGDARGARAASSVSVTVASRTSYGPAARRSVPAKIGPDLAERAVVGVLRVDERVARGELRVVDHLGDGQHRGDAGVGGGEVGDPLVAVAARGTRRGGRRGSRPARRRRSGASTHCSRPSARAEVGPEPRLDGGDR